MRLGKAERRDKRIKRVRYGMRISNHSIFDIQNAIIKRGEKAKAEREK
jgi:hypothetical protein